MSRAHTVNLDTKTETRSVVVPGYDLPANPCGVCGSHHDPRLPHDTHSALYQYSFRSENGRWPTIEDASSHCQENDVTAYLAAVKT